MDLPALDYINANGTLTPSGIELRNNTRQLLAVAFWVAHTPDNMPEAPIYVRGVHSVASPVSNATAQFTNKDAVMIEFDADSAPNFTYSGATIAEAANPLLWWTLECKTSAFMITPCLSTSLFSNAGWFKAKYGLCGTTINNACGIQAPTSMGCLYVEGGLLVQLSFMLQSDSMAFCDSVTSAPGMTYFLANFRTTGYLPCNAIMSVADDSTQRTAYFSCFGFVSVEGQVATLIPDLCCTTPLHGWVTITVSSATTSCSAAGTGLMAAIMLSVTEGITQGMQHPTDVVCYDGVGGLQIVLRFGLESDSMALYDLVSSAPGMNYFVDNSNAMGDLLCSTTISVVDSTRWVAADFSCFPIPGQVSTILPDLCCTAPPLPSFVTLYFSSAGSSCAANSTAIMAAITLSVDSTQGIQAPTSMSMACSDVSGDISIGVSFMLQSNAMAFYDSVTSAPGMTYFIDNNRATGNPPCNTFILVFEDFSQRTARFDCFPIPGQASTILPGMCCTVPPLPSFVRMFFSSAGISCAANSTAIMAAITLSVDSTQGIQAPTSMSMACSDVSGDISIGVFFMLQSNAMAFYDSVTSAPGMTYFIDNNRATGDLPCNTFILVFEDFSQRNARFDCFPIPGQVSTTLPGMCCTA
ncbi:hypothetical protein FOA52_005912 [Chlamydomonas sp. UWO 241]|nr:hypothetical protein FOA52_005912 [Chlamydomonas sp. UWO 241]